MRKEIPRAVTEEISYPLDGSCCQDSMGWKIVHETWPVLASELFEANELIYSTLKALPVKPS